MKIEQGVLPHASQRSIVKRIAYATEGNELGSGVLQRRVVTILEHLSWHKLCDLPVSLQSVCS